MSKIRKGAQHYCDHEWRWLGWLGVLALGIMVIGLHGIIVEREHLDRSSIVIFTPKAVPPQVKN